MNGLSDELVGAEPIAAPIAAAPAPNGGSSAVPDDDSTSSIAPASEARRRHGADRTGKKATSAVVGSVIAADSDSTNTLAVIALVVSAVRAPRGGLRIARRQPPAGRSGRRDSSRWRVRVFRRLPHRRKARTHMIPSRALPGTTPRARGSRDGAAVQPHVVVRRRPRTHRCGLRECGPRGTDASAADPGAGDRSWCSGAVGPSDRPRRAP